MSEAAQYMKAGDPVRIVPYDPAWPHLFARQGDDLRAALGSVAVRIDHIGSTAVPGLVAKPVIDIQISVAAFEPLTAYRLPLERLGYVFRADNTERTNTTTLSSTRRGVDWGRRIVRETCVRPIDIAPLDAAADAEPGTA